MSVGRRLLAPLLCFACAACVPVPAGPARGPRGWSAPAAEIPLPGPAAVPAAPAARESGPQPFYRSWWFWGAVGLAVIGGAAVAIGANLGGTERVARGADGRFTPATFPDRGATP